MRKTTASRSRKASGRPPSSPMARAAEIQAAHGTRAKRVATPAEELANALIPLIPELAASGLLDRPIFGSDSALTLACSRCDRRSVEALLAAGANPRAPTAFRQSPLMQCLHDLGHSTDWAKALPCMEALMRSGADILHRNEIGQSAIHWAAWESDGLEATRWLLAHGADPGAACDDGLTALHYAAKLGRTEIARLLVDAGAPLFEKDGHGGSLEKTPLAMATAGLQFHRNYELVGILAQAMSAAIEKQALQQTIKPAKSAEAASAKIRAPKTL